LKYPGITTLVLTCCLVSCLVCYGQTPATPERPWTRITAANDANTNEVALLRGRDGQLHVAWKRQTTPDKMDLLYTVIDDTGNVAVEAGFIVEGWNSLTVPALLTEKDGRLRVVFSGQSGASRSPYNVGSVYSALSSDGRSWKLVPGQLSTSGYAYTGPMSAAVDGRGVPVVAWAGSVQVGLGAKTQPRALQNGCCSYNPGLATDGASGEVVIGWFSNAEKQLGIFAETVSPSTSEKTLVPGSVTMEGGTPQSASVDQQIPLSGRLGAPGVFVAFCEGYPTAKSVDLWQYGQAKPTKIAAVNGGCRVHVAAGPEGRLWMMWSSEGKLFAARSNRAVSRWSTPISLEPPPTWDAIYRVKGEGSAGPLDAFAHVGAGGAVSTWYRRALPLLTIRTAPAALPAKGGNLAFTVSDVGDPVAGATIQVAGESLTTDSLGHALAHLRKGGAVPVSVAAPGYREATMTLGSRAASSGTGASPKRKKSTK
jgi:hypothetical protein